MSTAYRERLLPGPGWISVVIALVGMVAVAYGAALGPVAGLGVAIVGAAIAMWTLWRGSPVVTVDPDALRVAGAVLPIEYVGASRQLDREALTRILRGHDDTFKDTAFTVGPAWAPGRAVVIAVADDEDPHSCWIIPTRRPDALATAIESATPPTG